MIDVDVVITTCREFEWQLDIHLRAAVTADSELREIADRHNGQ
jgi:hypothetical protein